jgi:hypothetical protein
MVLAAIARSLIPLAMQPEMRTRTAAAHMPRQMNERSWNGGAEYAFHLHHVWANARGTNKGVERA